MGKTRCESTMKAILDSLHKALEEQLEIPDGLVIIRSLLSTLKMKVVQFLIRRKVIKLDKCMIILLNGFQRSYIQVTVLKALQLICFKHCTNFLVWLSNGFFTEPLKCKNY